MAIVKTNLHRNAAGLTSYLVTQKGNERVEIVANHGSMFTGLTVDDVFLTSRKMDRDFKKTRGSAPCYHVQISPGKDEAFTPDQIQQAIGIYLTEHKLEGRAHIATAHYKPDGMHIHIQISRYNPETGKLDPNKLWRDNNDRTRQRIELEFNHARTPQRNPRRETIKQQLSSIYGEPPDRFIEGVNRLGYALAYGGNRHHPWQLVDAMGVGHNLTKLIKVDGKSPTTKQLVERFKGIRFPTLNEAIALQRVKLTEYKQQMAKADQEAKLAEQFNYSPDSRVKGVVEFDIEKKQEAATAAIEQFRKEEERKEKLKQLEESLEDIMKRRKRGLRF